MITTEQELDQFLNRHSGDQMARQNIRDTMVRMLPCREPEVQSIMGPEFRVVWQGPASYQSVVLQAHAVPDDSVRPRIMIEVFGYMPSVTHPPVPGHVTPETGGDYLKSFVPSM